MPSSASSSLGVLLGSVMGRPKEYAEWYWNHISDKKADNPWWQFHVKNYGADFEYKGFRSPVSCGTL
jgi:alpha-L-fucosidase